MGTHPIFESDFDCLTDKKMSCCPPGSWPQLKTDYEAVGKETQLEGIRIYEVGTGKKCIIYNHDIFGWTKEDSGRTRQLCDLFASKGYYVVLPDYYHGDHRDPFKSEQADLVAFIKKTTNWGTLSKHVDTVMNHAKNQGAESFGAVGTCWGSYPVVKMSGAGLIKCGVSMHPSHGPISQMLGESEEELLKEIKVPQLFMPCGNDPAELKKGGLSEKILGDKLKIVEFPNRQHGFTGRGELTIPGVKEDLEKEIQEALSFFEMHM